MRLASRKATALEWPSIASSPRASGMGVWRTTLLEGDAGQALPPSPVSTGAVTPGVSGPRSGCSCPGGPFRLFPVAPPPLCPPPPSPLVDGQPS